MIAAEDCALVLLAAGRSERFGAPKLLQPLDGAPLGLHVARALAGLPFRTRVAVVGEAAPDYAAHGFAPVFNTRRDRDLASSLRLGIGRVAPAGPAAVVVALADMPRVAARHIHRLLDAADGVEAVVASSDGDHRTPPALFGRAHFDALLSLTGDAGARDLIRSGRQVIAPPDQLIDVDTPEQLERLRTPVR